jgi:WD40 repeat protein/tRNA A-37 threonylcarbamoyl transferase component Bud32
MHPLYTIPRNGAVRRGASATVWQAHDDVLGREVALKEIQDRHADHPESRARFLLEAEITGGLEHPGIVPVYEAGRWPDGTPFYAMKLVAGRSLRDLIAERPTIDERIALLHHVIAVADAIAYAHGRNIIHRDLKPSNVIIGDFGETVVIDWGLAKDLSTAEESTIGGGPFRAAQDDGLTSAGTILGTPAYMAPEQARGEPVDQRADVYAIGAMLWELSSLEKLPPGYKGQRLRMLRRASIDQDLATIIDKALDPDPGRRYPDAEALAADLKAFKVGARIAARRYSLWALLAHWRRRHRALAVSALGILAFALAGAVLYIRSVAAERDRADASEQRTGAARAAAEESFDKLTLKHAQLLLTTDPSEATDTLASYHGPDIDRATQILAEAKGRGVSLLRATPHTAMVRWMERTSDGSVVSLSTDGTLVRTDAIGRYTMLSQDVARFAQLSYSSARHLLAYACDPTNLCLYDVANNSRMAGAPVFRGIHAVGISFSEGGNLLAVMSQDTTLRVVDLSVPALPKLRLAKTIRKGSDVVFFRDDIVVAGTPDGIEFVHTNGYSQPFSIPNNSFWDANPRDGRFTIATVQGDALLFEGPPMRLVARKRLCNGPIVGLQFIPHRRDIVFGCREGQIGFWDPQHQTVTPRVRVEGYADLVRASETGEYIVATGGNGIVTLLDLRTELVTTYKGHESRVTALTPPSLEHPVLMSADVKGALRVWPLPTRFAKIVTTLNSQFNTDIFNGTSDMVVATTYFPMLTTYSPASGIQSFGPHEPHNFSLQQSINGNTIATYGLSELIEFWSTSPIKLISTVNTNQGSVTQLSFVHGTEDVVTSGRDGRLVRWTPSGRETLIAKISQPIDFFAVLPPDLAHEGMSAVFSSSDGALWHTTDDGQAVQFRRGDSRITRVITCPDHHTVLAGTVKGDVLIVNTQTWEHSTILHARGPVREITTTLDGRWIIVGTNDGLIHVSSMEDIEFDPSSVPWKSLSIRARHQAVTPDGLLIAVCSDGTIWLYSLSRRRWLCLSIGTADFRWVETSASGDAAAALDVEGRLIWLDLEAARKLLAASQQPANIGDQREESNQAP